MPRPPEKPASAPKSGETYLFAGLDQRLVCRVGSGRVTLIPESKERKNQKIAKVWKTENDQKIQTGTHEKHDKEMQKNSEEIGEEREGVGNEEPEEPREQEEMGGISVELAGLPGGAGFCRGHHNNGVVSVSVFLRAWAEVHERADENENGREVLHVRRKQNKN